MSRNFWIKANYLENRGEPLVVEVQEHFRDETLKTVIDYLVSDEISKHMKEQELKIINYISKWKKADTPELYFKNQEGKLGEIKSEGKPGLEEIASHYIMEVTEKLDSGEKVKVDILELYFTECPVI